MRQTDAGAAVGVDEARRFAESVATVVERHPTPDPWRPDQPSSDANAALEAALTEIGWDELAADNQLLPLVAPAAVPLGAGLAPLSTIDRLLGGALVVDGQARYASEGDQLVAPTAGGLQTFRAGRLEPVGYLDAWGVALVHERGGAEPLEAGEARFEAWVAAGVGYLAGLASRALATTVDHTKARVAFGTPLAGLEPVQQQLATAATLRDGLLLLSEEPVSPQALLHATSAACEVTAICHQLCGAVAFTLEFDLQRTLRRARATREWADGAVYAWSER